MMASRRVMVFDFDGTLTNGPESARLYADEVRQAVSEPRRANYMHCINTALAADPHGIAHGALDGFDLVRRVAQEYGVDPDLLQQAYVRSRERLMDPSLVLRIPHGLKDFCEQLDAHLVIATNSPDIGIRQQLDRWGMADTFDQVVTDTGKPAGLSALIRRLQGNALCTKRETDIAAVGDILVNDIEPARQLGCTTALVTHGRAVSPDSATFMAPELEGVYEPLIAWSHGELGGYGL